MKENYWCEIVEIMILTVVIPVIFMSNLDFGTICKMIKVKTSIKHSYSEAFFQLCSILITMRRNIAKLVAKQRKGIP